MKRTYTFPWRSISPVAPLYILIGLACISIASYILMSLMLRPNGDDYGWLDTYHQASNWFTATFNFMHYDNGRYAQNLSIAIPYGLGGKKFLLLTGILSTGVFIAGIYFGLRAIQKLTKLALSKLQTLLASSLFFLAYTTSSLTYIGIRGELDNTFQNLLWYAGFITYTFPILLLIALTSITYLYNRNIRERRWPLVVILATSIIAGLYGETTAVLYIANVVIVSLAWLALTKAAHWKEYFVRARNYLMISLGTTIGLFITYTSPASSARREIIQNNASLSDIIVAALRGTKHFLVHNLIPSWPLFIFVLCIGAAIGLWVLQKKYLQPKQLACFVIIGFIVAGVMGTTNLLIAFVSIFKGYGIGGYIPPRFEIFYNIWFVAAWLCIGVLLGWLLLTLVQRYTIKQAFALSSSVILCGVIVLTPAVLSKAAERTKKIAVYSQQWDDANDMIELQISEGKRMLYVPTIDIGDGYGMPCGDDWAKNWLGATKANYYNIDNICTPGHR